MAEVVGVVGSAVSIFEAAQKIRRFAKDVIHAPTERNEFVKRLSCLETVTKAIDECKATQPGLAWVKELDPDNKNSPVFWLLKTMKDMEIILKVDATDMSLKAKLKNFKWHSEKKTLDLFFNQIKDHCISILVVLGWGNMSILKEIGTITRATQANLDRIAAIMDDDRRERREIDAITRGMATHLDEDRMESREMATITKSMAAKMECLEASVDADRKERKREREKSERKLIEKWLSPLEFQSRQQTIFEKAASFQKGRIGQWFLEGEEFKYWKQGRIKVLRGYGEPGAGKTILSSVVVHDLVHKSPETPVLCVYLEKTERLVHTSKNLRGSLLKQLVQFKESGLSPAIRDAYERATQTNTGPDDTETTILLKAEIESYQRVYVIVDGLDEASDESRRLFQRDLRKLSLEKLSILVMSRPDDALAAEAMFCDICDPEFGRPCIKYYHCQDCFQQFKVHISLCCSCMDKGESCPEDSRHTLKETIPENYEVSIRTPDQDLELFLRSAIEDEMPEELSSTDLSSPRCGIKEFIWQCYHNHALFGRIVSYIIDNSDGRFLLAREYLKHFKNKNTLRDIKSALKNRKEDGSDKVFPFYTEDMDRIMKQEEGDADLARQVLSLVYCAKRNLKLEELQQALATRLGDTEYDPDGAHDQRTILNVTKGLIGIDRDTSDEDKDLTVRFDHLTRREYFDKYWKDWFSTGKVDIANICLTFLSFDEFSEPCSSEDDFKLKEKQLPFISYAVQFWGDHVRDAGPGASEVVAAAVRYLQDPSRVEAYIQAAWTANTRHRDKWDVRRTIHPLHICGWFDLGHLIPVLNYDAELLNIQEETHGQTPLMYACRRGNVKTVRFLLQLGALVNKRSEKGRTALFEAILRLRKEDNSDKDIEKSLKIVELMLDPNLRGRQLDVNIRNPRLLQRTALIVSIEYQQTDIALAILKHPNIKINLQDLEGTSALCLAACNGLVEVVEALVQFKSIKIDLTENGEDRTALLLAAKYSCHSEAVSVLLKSGADPSHADSRGGTAILRAVEAGNDAVFKILVESTDPRVDLSCVDEDGRSLMHWAAEMGHIETIKTLNEKQLLVNARDGVGMTPLHDACRCGKLDAARLLLETGADSAIKDNYGRTPFTVAWQYGHTKLMEICKNGTDSETESANSLCVEDLPVWSLATLRRLDLISEVVSSRRIPLDVEEPRTQRTALHCVLLDDEKDIEKEKVQAQILRELLATGNMSPDDSDKHKQTPLHFAAMYGNLEATKVLLEHDAKLDETDQFGVTPLIIAYKNENTDVATALVKAGARIDESRLDLEELLFAALKLQNYVAVDSLMRAGADRMAQDEEGRTPDMVAQQAKDEKLMRILKSTKSFRWKAPTMGLKTQLGVSDLEEIIEEVEDMLDEVSDIKVPADGLSVGGVSAKQIHFTPFASRPVNLKKEVGTTFEVSTKEVPSTDFRSRQVEEVEEIPDPVPATQMPSIPSLPEPSDLREGPLLCT